MGVVSFKGSLLLMAFLIHTALTAPVIEENTALHGPSQIAEGKGCYYNYEHYDEGDRIMTNEPCLNCTCHNRMLMCYLRVCPFTKAIGQDCKVEKKPDQCCPVITCPQVPVALLTSSTTETTASTTTAVGHPDSYGCVLDDNVFYADGAQVPSDPRKPCELCYCIRNQTACVMQECTLNVEGCKPVYQEAVCCPVRYDCDYDEVLTTPRPTAGLVTTPGGPNECKANDQIYQDGEMITNMTENPCEHCYCMRGDVVCAVQECGTPLENTECTPMPAEPGQCCPNTYQCPNGTVPAHVLQATPNLKPSPPVAPSLAQIKPDTETEKPTSDDKIVEDSETTNDGQESENAGEEQQEPEKTDGSPDSTVAESSEVITEAPKEEAIIEIITTAAPPDDAKEQTHGFPSEALQTEVEQHPEAHQEISSVPEIVPEHDQVEEGHADEEHVQEGHVEDGQHEESHDVEATTAPGHYTEISVENVEMNTSPPEVAKPEILSASHSLDENEPQTVNTEAPLELTTLGPSSPLIEQLPQNENQDVSNQQVEHDASGKPESQDTVSQPENQDAVSQPEKQDAINQPENQETISQPENQDVASQPEKQDAISQPENQEAISKPENQDAIAQSEHHEAASQIENQPPTSQPDAQGASIQSEIQETTVRSEIQEITNQLDNQVASSQQDKQETVQPENQDASSQQVNEESSSQSEIDTSPTEPTPSSQMPQEPLPQENEKLSAVNDLPETTPAPLSSTTTTEAEPVEMPRIPGEGSCLHKGITYASNTEVPSTNACKRCRCTNSIVQCNDLECPEPPISLYSNCVPMPPTDDACCPTYFCEQKPSQEPEVDNMSIDKIDQGVEDVEPEEGIAQTTVASVHEDVPAAHENFVPGTHEISDYTNPIVEDGSQPESQVSEDAEEVKPSGEGSQPESVIPSGEGSQPEYTISSEVSQPESDIPTEVSQSEPDPVVSAAEPQASVDITTAIPEGPSDHQESTILDQHEENPIVPSEDVHPVSHDNIESESTHDTETTPTTAPSEIVPEEQGSKLEEAQSISEVPQTTAGDDQKLATESPQHPGGEQVSPSDSEDAQPLPEHSLPDATNEGSTAQPEHGEPLESQGSHDVLPTNENLEETIETTVAPVHEDVAHMENGQETEPQHGDLTNQEPAYLGETHNGQESVTENESGASAAAITDAPSVSPVEHEDVEHDSEPSGSSQPIEGEHIPTIDQAENDLTATHDLSAPDSPTTAIPEEISSVHAEYNEAQLPSTEGPSGASENPEIPEPMVTSGPPVLFPDISHQGAPIHIPGPAGINTDGLTSEDERLGVTEAPIQEPSQTEQPQTPEVSSSSGSVQQASEVSEGGIKDDTVYTTEGLNAVPHQTAEAANEVVSNVGSEADSENNQITESSQTSEPDAHDDANEILPPGHEPSQSGDSQVEEVKEPERVEPSTEVYQSVTEIQQEQVQHHDESEIQPTHENAQVQGTHEESEVQPTHDESEAQPTHDGDEAQPTHEESEAQPTHDGAEVQPTHDGNEAQPTHEESEAQPTHDGAEVQPTYDGAEAQPTHDGAEVQPTHDGAEAQPTHDGAEAQPTHDGAEVQPTHDGAEAQPTHDGAGAQPTHDGAEAQPTNDGAEAQPTHDGTEAQPTHDGAEVQTTHAGAEAQPTHEESEAQPTHDGAEVQPTHDGAEVQPTHDGAEAQPTHDGAEVQPTHDESEAQPTHDESEAQPTHDSAEAQPTHDESEAQPTHDGAETQPTHDESEAQPTHDASEAQLTHDGAEVQPTHDGAEAQPTHDESEAQPTHDGAEVQPTHDESEAQPTHDGAEVQPTHETDTHERPAGQQVETEAPSIPEKDVSETEVIPTETPQAPIVTHGDLPTPSGPSADNVIQPDNEIELEKQPEPSQTQQPLDAEVSASQPAVESQGHEQVEPESEQPQEVTQAPENDEVVTHIDSAGPQQVPEIANQVVETDTNAVEHGEEPSAPTEGGKTDVGEVAHTAEDHHEPSEQEEHPQPEDPSSIPEEHHADVVPAEHQEHPDIAPAEHQEHPDSDHVPIQEDHSEGHTGPYLSGAHNLEENQEQQTEKSVSEIPSEQIQLESQQPEIAQTGAEQSESSTEQLSGHIPTEEAQSEPSGPQENEQTQPEVTHDKNQPEEPLVEEHLEHQEPHPDQTLVGIAEASHSDVIDQEPIQTTAIPEQQGPSQDAEVQPEQQNVVSGQQVDEGDTKPAVSEHQETPEVTGDAQETPTQQESGSGQPSIDGQAPQIEETQEHVPQVSHDSAPAASGEEEAQTAAPVVGETIHTEDATSAPEQPEYVGESQQPLVEEEKDVDHTIETTLAPAVQHEDLLEQTHEQPATPEGQPNESTVLSPEAPESEPSGSDLPITTPEEVPIESGPSAPSAPESAPSAPESVAPEEPSAPELVVPELPSALEPVVPEHPSAPEYTAPEQPSAPESEVQPSAPEQPVVPETQSSSSGQDEVPAPQESDIPSQPDQSSHLVEEIEKEQPVLETSSSPIAELLQSSPLPPVEMPSTEGPVLPPGLQTWAQKPYHPPSLPEHQQHHHTTAEVPHLPEDSHYPSQPYDQDYEDEDNVSYGPGTCRYGGKVYLSAQQIPRDDPCDFCFCFRSDIICLQQSCPPPIRGCYQETIKGFCCPRYECHVSMATMVNITTTSTTTTTTVPPHFLSHHYNGSAMKAGCQVKGIAYRVGDRIPSTSGPCLDCRCGADGQMKCDPTVCGPQESLLRQVMAASVSKRRRR